VVRKGLSFRTAAWHSEKISWQIKSLQTGFGCAETCLRPGLSRAAGMFSA
jgi:hypothetical protein